MTFETTTILLPHIREGKLKGLAVTSDATQSAGAGNSDHDGGRAAGLCRAEFQRRGRAGGNAARGRSPSSTRRSTTFCERPEVQAEIAKLGGTINIGSPQDFATFIAREAETLARGRRRRQHQGGLRTSRWFAWPVPSARFADAALTLRKRNCPRQPRERAARIRRRWSLAAFVGTMRKSQFSGCIEENDDCSSSGLCRGARRRRRGLVEIRRRPARPADASTRAATTLAFRMDDRKQRIVVDGTRRRRASRSSAGRSPTPPRSMRSAAKLEAAGIKVARGSRALADERLRART